MTFFQEIPLDRFQSETIARGLFAVARADGVHDREAALVASFWAESGGSAQALSELERRESITADELARDLPTPELRRLFMKTAILLALADGKVTDKERDLLHAYADRLELKADMPLLETQVKEFLIGHLSHLQNAEAVVEVVRKLSL